MSQWEQTSRHINSQLVSHPRYRSSMWYVGGSRPDGDKGFHPGVQLYLEVSSPKVPSLRKQVTQPHPDQRGHPRITVHPSYTKESPYGEQCLSTTDKTTLYK